jgi:coronin-1B/1C/6
VTLCRIHAERVNSFYSQNEGARHHTRIYFSQSMIGLLNNIKRQVRYCSANQPKDDKCMLNVEWNGTYDLVEQNPKSDTHTHTIHNTGQPVDESGASANAKWFGMGLKSGGGGPFFVYDVNGAKRFGPTKFSLHGHTAKVTASMFHPFNDDIVATGSADCTVKLWKIPSDGLTAHLKESLLTLDGHSKRIQFTNFHPTSNNILATACATNANEVKVWDITTGDECFSFDDNTHGGLIVDMKWNWDGTLLGSSCKDKNMRFFDPRTNTVATKFVAHDSLRPTKFCFLGDGKVLTTGFKGGKREARVWDIRNSNKQLGGTRIDTESAPLFPVYNRGTNIVLMAAKGGTSVKVYEYDPSSGDIFHCSNSSFKEQCRGFAMVPKRNLDILGVEVARMMWVGRNKVIPLSFKIPRKTRRFVPEFYPDEVAGIAAQEGADWLKGSDKPPVTASLDPKKKGDGSVKRKSSTTFKIAKSRVELERELESALSEIASMEKMKNELLAKLAEKGIEPEKLDLSNLPPPPPEPTVKEVAPARPARKSVEKEEKVEEKPKPKPVASVDADPKPDVVKKKKKKGPMLTIKKNEPKKNVKEEQNGDDSAPKKTTKKKKKVTMSDIVADITKRLDDMDMNTLKKILDLCKSKEGDADW